MDAAKEDGVSLSPPLAAAVVASTSSRNRQVVAKPSRGIGSGTAKGATFLGVIRGLPISAFTVIVGRVVGLRPSSLAASLPAMTRRRSAVRRLAIIALRPVAA